MDEVNDYLIFDVMNSSIEEMVKDLVDGKTSNVEQYQQILANMDPTKRSAYKLRLKNKQLENYSKLQKLLRGYARDFDKKVEAFKLSGGEITYKNGVYCFNGLQAITDYVAKPKLNHNEEIQNCVLNIEMCENELKELEAKASKSIFRKNYKKERRQELKRLIAEYSSLKDGLIYEQDKTNKLVQKERAQFEQAKDLLKSIEMISIITNNMQKIHCLLAYMNKTNVHGLSASQFVKEFKSAKIEASQTLKNVDVVQSIINHNNTYKYKVTLETLKEFGNVAVNIKAPVSRKTSEKQDSQEK